MASGLGAVGRGGGLVPVVQRHLVGSTQIGASGLMARLAPACTIPHGGGVVHALGKPTSCTAVAGVAVQCRTASQLRFRNVVSGFCQGAFGTRRQVTAVVAGLAGGSSHHAVVHRH